MSEFRICGTALAHGEALHLEQQFRRALRALARGDRMRARELAPPPLQRTAPGSSVCKEAVAYAYASLGERPESEVARRALLARAAELDKTIAEERRTTNDAIMWSCRTKIERAQAAMVLGDPSLALSLCEAAIAALSSIWGRDHLEVGNYHDDLATALFALDRTADAHAAIDRARAIKTAHRFSYDDLG
jgi:hypothetical protein